MIQTSTHHDLIKFLYDETSAKEDNDMQRRLMADENLLEEFMQMIVLKSALEEVCLNPSDQVIQNILHYSKSFKTHI
jgi:hypothetical protein